MLWPIQPTPQKKESFYSYICRTSNLNLGDLKANYKLLGVRYRPNNPNPIYLDEINTSIFTSLVVDNRVLNDWLLLERGAGNTDCFLFGQKFPRYLLSNKVKVCPFCLHDHNTFNSEWYFTHITTCIEHQCLLLDSCPSCIGLFSWSEDLIYQCAVCNMQWKDTGRYIENYIKVEKLDVHKLLYYQLNKNNKLDKGQYPLEVLKLRYIDLVYVLSFFSWLASDHDDYWNGKYIDKLNIFEIYEGIQHAGEVILSWPANFDISSAKMKTEKFNTRGINLLQSKFDVVSLDIEKLFPELSTQYRVDRTNDFLEKLNKQKGTGGLELSDIIYIAALNYLY